MIKYYTNLSIVNDLALDKLVNEEQITKEKVIGTLVRVF